MKRFFSFAIILVMLISLAACGKQTAVTDPTEAPVTQAPTNEAVKVTPEPTEAPEEPENGAFFKELHADEPLTVDIDGDGADDTVLVTKTVMTSGGSEEYTHTVTITLASDPENPFEKSFERCYGFSGAVADFDSEDGRMEVIFSYDEESCDYVTFVFRVNEEGAAIDVFEESMMLGEDENYFNGYPENYSFDPEKGLVCQRPTEILGTFMVKGRFTVDKDGIRSAADMYEYPETNEEWGRITLTKELALTRLNEDLTDAEEVTLPVGTVIIQRYTDLASWVIVATEDGALYKASVRISETPDEWKIFINDVWQDELGEIFYAG